MGGGGLIDAVELDEDDALLLALLVGLGGGGAGQKTAAARGNRRSRELGIFRKRIRIGNRKIRRDPIGLGHDKLPVSVRVDYQAGGVESEGGSGRLCGAGF